MPINITMPALSPTMEEGNLAKWLVKEGDTVSSGDIIAEIETDKATMEVEAVDEGTVGKIVVSEGTEGVKVNAVIAILLEEGEEASDISDAPSGDTGSTAENKEEAGEKQREEEEPAAEANDDAPSPAKAPAAPKNEEGERIFSSPLARRIAKEKGLDLATLKGSGPHGRIVKADVENAKPVEAKREDKAAPDAKPAAALASGANADQVRKLYGDREFEEVALDGMRKTIAARLTEAKQTIPHFYLRRDIELDALLKFRAKLNKGLETKGVKLSVNDFVIKACALALQDIPDCNAAWAGDRVLKFKASDVAVAVAIDGGLITPVIRDAEVKTMSALSTQMKDMAARAKTRKLAPTEYQGGSFAVSNLGMLGIENFDAVINPPHGAILAVGAGLKKPVVKDDKMAIATVMSVTLSVDHRVIDGALGAQLLAAIKSYLEEPISMLV
ncbi:pyruvate dehydrogenase complex dihydrolipoamide acetyltransferase [Pikeienuella piscinae]|uniref:Acetyltransferase component of pyruvate dehydrogenase complex n=1 Tax=Pikeienuella piscinae TaxID=2748098 RepID=A0A7L5BUS4_9RHOB|nr:pyruvate dehydrogenase complex dihydrolipoamide acetyltransferase [Pikeienuella piscinae]QIE54498.1 pyruvate dehydrogenase complex dihydrolipoamide acetyltransferase [Pikeienuella piscinae]